MHWVNSPSPPPVLALAKEVWGVDDWRPDRLLLLYNDISQQIMADRGIPIIDQYGITDSLHDMLYDLGYYINLRVSQTMCLHGDEIA